MSQEAMKLTDEVVAKALGYQFGNLQPFTTSLDSIVEEIEARGLWWDVQGAQDNMPSKSSQYWAYVHTNKEHIGATAPLALCAALLQFIKESKP